MPIREFKCSHPRCPRSWEMILTNAQYQIQKARAFNALSCPYCGQRAPTLVVSAPAVHGAACVVLPDGPGTPPEMQGKEYKSYKEVERAKEKLGWRNCGDPNPVKGRGRMNQEAADEIRAKYKAGGITHKALAKEYAVSEATIGSILNNRSWVAKPKTTEQDLNLMFSAS